MATASRNASVDGVASFASVEALLAAVPELDAICEAVIEAEGEMDLKSAKAYVRIVENSQMLRGRASELMRNSLQEITRVVSKRRGLDEPDAEARLFGEVTFAVYQSALKDWRDDRVTGTLEAALRERFQMLQAIFGGAATESESRRS